MLCGLSWDRWLCNWLGGSAALSHWVCLVIARAVSVVGDGGYGHSCGGEEVLHLVPRGQGRLSAAGVSPGSGHMTCSRRFSTPYRLLSINCCTVLLRFAGARCGAIGTLGGGGGAMERVPAAQGPTTWPCKGGPLGRSSDSWLAGAALQHDREVAPALASGACAMFWISLFACLLLVLNSYGAAQALGKLPCT